MSRRVPSTARQRKRRRGRNGRVYTRNPVLLALSFVGLAEIAPGRILMGLGAGSPGVLAPQGIAFSKRLTRLKAYCEVIPPLIRGEQVTHCGEGVELVGAEIEDLLSARGGPAAVHTRLPLRLGVTGPRAAEYAGEVAHGVLMNACLPADKVASRRELLARGPGRPGVPWLTPCARPSGSSTRSHRAGNPPDGINPAGGSWPAGPG